jgi:autophagy-related protein 9
MSIYHDESGSPTRRLSGSRSMLGSTARSQPFLNMLSPMGTSGGRYAGYTPAGQAVVPEEDEDEGEGTERETIALAPPRRVSWRASPNVHGADSSDDEVPQSFMIETNAPPARPRPKNKSRGSKPKERERPPRPTAAASSPPILPVGGQLPPQVSIPPRPSEVGGDPSFETGPTADDADGEPAAPRPQMRGLDAYERALWNWVNVYNLDAFLQEVYFYYEGKGIYCIALARVLNLL